MKQPTLTWKFTYIALAVAVVQSDRQLWYAAALAWFVLIFWLLIASVFSRIVRSVIPVRPGVLLLPVFFFSITGVHTELNDPPGAPQEWFSYAGSPDNPQYDRAFLIRAELTEFVSPGNFIADIQILEKQKQIRYMTYRTVKKYKQPLRLRSFLSINDKDLRQGCILTARVTGRAAPHKPGNTGFASYLKRKRADSILRLSKKYNVLNTDCKVTARSQIRSSVRKTLNSALDATSAAIATGLLFGKSGYLERELKDQARHLGILHLFAASGLHLGIFYGCLYLPLAVIYGKKSRTALSLPLIPAAVYLWLLDFPVSLSRAFLFLSLFALRAYLHRSVSTANHLANTAIILLIWQPYETASVSGALSFGAVSGILYFYKSFEEDLFAPGTGRPAGRLRKALLKTGSFIRAQLSVSLSAGLFTSPVIAFTFRGFPYFSTAANMILVPVAGILLPVLYFTVAVHYVLVPFTRADFVWIPVQFLFHVFTGLTRFLSNYSLFIDYESAWNFALFFSILIAGMAIIYRHYRPDWKKRIRRKTVWLILLLPFVAGLTYAVAFTFGNP